MFWLLACHAQTPASSACQTRGSDIPAPEGSVSGTASIASWTADEAAIGIAAPNAYWPWQVLTGRLGDCPTLTWLDDRTFANEGGCTDLAGHVWTGRAEVENDPEEVEPDDGAAGYLRADAYGYADGSFSVDGDLVWVPAGDDWIVTVDAAVDDDAYASVGSTLHLDETLVCSRFIDDCTLRDGASVAIDGLGTLGVLDRRFPGGHARWVAGADAIVEAVWVENERGLLFEDLFLDGECRDSFPLTFTN